jgi:PEGA domain
VGCCPCCQSRRIRRRRVPWFARIAKRLTARRPYICDSCGWRGWRTPLLAPRVFVQLPPQTRDSTKVDPLSSTVGEDGRPCDPLELFESEKPSCQEGIPEHQPESVRQAAPAEATPRVESPTAPWLPRVRSHALRLFHRVSREQLVSGMRRYPLRRLEVSRSEVLRSSGFFAFGLAAGAFVVWSVSESALQAPSADRPSPMAVATTGTRPAESPPPSRLSVPVSSTGQIPSVAPRRQSAQAPTRNRQMTAVVFGRPAPSRPERRSIMWTSPAAQSTEAVVGPTAAATLARSRGSLAVDSYPQVARVSVDGLRVGSTPLLLQNVPAGTHLVRVEADGYQVWAWTARVVANQRSSVTTKLYRTGNR